MTDEERKQEGAEEGVEDLEAPAESQDDVAGGQRCIEPTRAKCIEPSCAATAVGCERRTKYTVVYNT